MTFLHVHSLVLPTCYIHWQTPTSTGAFIEKRCQRYLLYIISVPNIVLMQFLRYLRYFDAIFCPVSLLYSIKNNSAVKPSRSKIIFFIFIYVKSLEHLHIQRAAWFFHGRLQVTEEWGWTESLLWFVPYEELRKKTSGVPVLCITVLYRLKW